MSDDIRSSTSQGLLAATQDAKLRAIVDAFPGQGFAVVDGGHFDDLPALFKRERLFARSLFLDTADLAVQAAGPWLVKLDQAPDATDKVFTLVGDKPAVVFWCCQVGEMVLWRHLRTLNMARIPVWAADGGQEPPSDPGQADDYQAVMFRHWDPRVLGALLPVLDAAQFARFLRPAAEMTFFAPHDGGARRIVDETAWPPAPSSLLTIHSAQIEALNGRRLTASHRRIAACLRELEPEISARVSDAEMRGHILISDRTGRDLGLGSEVAHGDWAYLMLMTHGRVARSREVTSFIGKGDQPPDVQVRRLLLHREQSVRGWTLTFARKVEATRGGSL